MNKITDLRETKQFNSQVPIYKNKLWETNRLNTLKSILNYLILICCIK